MRVQIEVEKTSLANLRKELLAAAERGKDPTPVLREVADDFRDASAAFLRNPRWANKLSPEYAAQKARAGHGTRIGVVSGAMFASLTSKNAPGHYEDLDADSIEIGSKDPNAIRFNQGAYRKTKSGAPNRQPKRKLYRLRVRDRKLILQRVRDYLLDPLL